ncbi:MAG: hypothetical protein GAK31_02296 [Stenotrophomonas maltophilia]|uniref:Uncharacterized protein n=1 Tax=Stenotrophomonas maltophilia TaxID=40324 RepID=A0A7V8JL98_STEMA|nr:MAG: hypothetical protein GAK31_02296 [Stenotrophomonas maltophilia]
MHLLAHGGRCVGILAIRRLFRLDFDRHANPHRPPPCTPQVALPCEVAAMTPSAPACPRLHALLGAALPGLQLSHSVTEALEDALAEAHEHAPLPAFFARLRSTAQRHAADGQHCHERHLSEARGRALAEATRCLAALSACGGCCWLRNPRARWMMQRRSARHRWGKACCMRWWCWPIMPGRWWHRLPERGWCGADATSPRAGRGWLPACAGVHRGHRRYRPYSRPRRTH